MLHQLHSLCRLGSHKLTRIRMEVYDARADADAIAPTLGLRPLQCRQSFRSCTDRLSNLVASCAKSSGRLRDRYQGGGHRQPWLGRLVLLAMLNFSFAPTTTVLQSEMLCHAGDAQPLSAPWWRNAACSAIAALALAENLGGSSHVASQEP